MREKSAINERDRESTEQKLLETIGLIIDECGFEKIGVNLVASRSNVSKILIYRYFGSIEGLMAAYIRQHDFWINFPLDIPEGGDISAFVKSMFKGQIEQLRTNPTLRRLYRWELSVHNDMIVRIREQREAVGTNLVKLVSRSSNLPESQIAAMATILSASITYLVMLEEFCPTYNGIDIQTDSGWEQLLKGIDSMIDSVFNNQ